MAAGQPFHHSSLCICLNASYPLHSISLVLSQDLIMLDQAEANFVGEILTSDEAVKLAQENPSRRVKVLLDYILPKLREKFAPPREAETEEEFARRQAADKNRSRAKKLQPKVKETDDGRDKRIQGYAKVCVAKYFPFPCLNACVIPRTFKLTSTTGPLLSNASKAMERVARSSSRYLIYPTCHHSEKSANMRSPWPGRSVVLVKISANSTTVLRQYGRKCRPRSLRT